MTGEASGRRRALLDTVRPALSAPARDVFARLALVRDPERTVDEATLVRLLEARGLPVHAAALEVERRAGGAALRPGMYLGVYAALWAAERGRPSVDPPTRGPRAPAPLPILLPGPGAAWHHAAAIDEAGVVHLVVDDDDAGFAAPAFDRFAQYLEVYAMLRDALAVAPRDEGLPWHRLRVEAPSVGAGPDAAGARDATGATGAIGAIDAAGAALARALGAEPFPPASGTWCRAWRRDGLCVVALAPDGLPADLQVATPDEASAREAVERARARCLDVTWWTAGRRAATGPGLPPPARRWQADGREVLQWGPPRELGWPYDALVGLAARRRASP